mmetsp:Transcript_40438/g.115779  ORF Transcript_40438/g.115779 Transcript_40438/m.115779 type:complete len:222 (-) Transcript_40438:174-839(-)
MAVCSFDVLISSSAASPNRFSNIVVRSATVACLLSRVTKSFAAVSCLVRHSPSSLLCLCTTWPNSFSREATRFWNAPFCMWACLRSFMLFQRSKLICFILSTIPQTSFSREPIRCDNGAWSSLCSVQSPKRAACELGTSASIVIFLGADSPMHASRDPIRLHRTSLDTRISFSKKATRSRRRSWLLAKPTSSCSCSTSCLSCSMSDDKMLTCSLLRFICTT